MGDQEDIQNELERLKDEHYKLAMKLMMENDDNLDLDKSEKIR